MKTHPLTYQSLQDLPPIAVRQRVGDWLKKGFVFTLSLLYVFPFFKSCKNTRWGSLGYIEFLRRKGRITHAIDHILLQLRGLPQPMNHETSQTAWQYLTLAVNLAKEQQLNPTLHLLQQIDELRLIAHQISLQQGFDCAYVYICFSLWAFARGDLERSIAVAVKAMAADDTWGYPHYFMGWLGCFSGTFNPVPHLINAVSRDWTYFHKMQKDPLCLHHPEIIKQVRQKLLVLNNKRSKIRLHSLR